MDTTIEQRVLAELNEREIVELAGELIRIPSFCPDETPVARFLAGYFEIRGTTWSFRRWNLGDFRPSPRSAERGAAGASCSTGTSTSIP